MPQREAKFAVNVPLAELWRVIRDFESLCTCVPGVERIKRIDDSMAELTVKEKVGVVPLIVNLTARIETENPPHSLHAVAKAEHLAMEIDVALREVESGTELLTIFKVAGEGQLKPIVDRLFERRATERTLQFADCLERRFGAVSPRDAGEELRGRPCPQRTWIGRLSQWPRLLWQRILRQFKPPPNQRR